MIRETHDIRTNVCRLLSHLLFAWRWLCRDARAGELNILCLALLIAVASTTAIGLFTDRLQQTLTQQAAEFLAADVLVTGHETLPSSWFSEAGQRGLLSAQTAEFSSVVLHGNALLLTGVKAVSAGYPLRGYLKTRTTDPAMETRTDTIPEPGTAWVETRVLTSLGVSLGDWIEVGDKKLQVTRLLTYEPDRKGNLYSLSPRILMHYDDLAATRVIQPGSHVHHYALFAGDGVQWTDFEGWLRQQLVSGQRLMTVREGRPEIGSALERAERYLGLSSIVVVAIAGVAVAMAARRYSERHFDAMAMLRCLGAQQRQISFWLLSQLTIIGLVTAVAGCALGWFMQYGLLRVLADFLPARLAEPGWRPVGLGFMTGLITLAGFATASVLRLRRTAPLRVLRRHLEPVAMKIGLVYALALVALTALVWYFSGDMKLTLSVVFGGVLLVGLLGLLLLGFLRLSRHWLSGVPLAWRLGWQNIHRQPMTSVTQMVAFAVTLLAMSLLFLVRSDLLEDWRTQLPQQAPNHFALNIFSDQLDAFQQWMRAEQIPVSQVFPITRGRLTQVNHQPVRRLVSKDSQGERAINRDLSLTWSEILPEGNQLVAGHWWPANTEASNGAQVSIEAKLADNMGIKVGDLLTFTLEGQTLTAHVGSIRSLRWDTMRPNFYMIFAPGDLNGFTHTWMTSFYLTPDQKPVLNRLVQQFPGMTLLDVDLLLQQLRRMVQQLMAAIEYILLFALLAGFVVLFAAVRASLDMRIYESVLLRALGASRRLLRISQWLEFALLGFLAGLLAVLVTEGLLWLLYHFVFELTFRVNVGVCASVPLAAALIVGGLGYANTRSVRLKSPVRVLRDMG